MTIKPKGIHSFETQINCNSESPNIEQDQQDPSHQKSARLGVHRLTEVGSVEACDTIVENFSPERAPLSPKLIEKILDALFKQTPAEQGQQT